MVSDYCWISCINSCIPSLPFCHCLPEYSRLGAHQCTARLRDHWIFATRLRMQMGSEIDCFVSNPGEHGWSDPQKLTPSKDPIRNDPTYYSSFIWQEYITKRFLLIHFNGISLLVHLYPCTSLRSFYTLSNFLRFEILSWTSISRSLVCIKTNPWSQYWACRILLSISLLSGKTTVNFANLLFI